MNARRRRAQKSRGISGSLERALLFVRQLVAEKSPPRAASIPPSPSSDLPSTVRHLQEQEQRLKRTVVSLEDQLDQMHAAMVSGTLPIPASEAVRQYRRLRERLQDKALALTRLERQVARELRLHSRDSEPPPAFAKPTPQTRDLQHRYELAQRMLADGGLGGTRAERIAIEDRVRFLFDPDPDTRRAAAMELVERAPGLAVDLLGFVVDDPNARVRLAALNALGLLGSDSGAWMIFERLLRDPNVQVRVGALRGLASASPERSMRFIRSALEDVESEVRRGAVTTLGWLRGDQCLEPLLFALRDANPAVRIAAIDALGSLGDDRSVLSLIRMVGDPVGGVAAEAWTALRALLGQDLPEAAVDLAPNDAVASLQAWWARARVDRALGELADGKRGAIFRKIEAPLVEREPALAHEASEAGVPMDEAQSAYEAQPAALPLAAADAMLAQERDREAIESTSEELLEAAPSVGESPAVAGGSEEPSESIALANDMRSRAQPAEAASEEPVAASPVVEMPAEEAPALGSEAATDPGAETHEKDVDEEGLGQGLEATEGEEALGLGIESDAEATADGIALGLDATEAADEEGLGLGLDSEDEDFLPLMSDDDEGEEDEEGEGEGEDEEYESLL